MLRKNLFDIEVYSPNTFPLPEKAEHPICSNTIYDSFSDSYTSIIIDSSRAGQKITYGNWTIYFVKDERNVIILSVKLVKFFSPDVFAGWYSNDFDVPYFFNRCNNLEMKNILNGLSPLNYVNIRGKSISGMHLTDMILLDKKIKKRTSYTLANVAIEENLPVKKLEKHEDIMEIYRTDKDRFVTYNKGDVEVLVELEKKNKIIDFFENTRTAFGLNDINEALKNSVVVDVAALRKAHREGIILPSKPTREESEESEEEDRSGGLVIFPNPGIYRNVAVLDMAKFYPKILGLLNLSPEVIVAFGLTKEQINFADGDYYVEYEEGKYVRINSKVKGFMPSLYQEFLDERLKVEREMKKYEIDSPEYNFLVQKRQVVKDTSNSLPGTMGYGGFRLNNNIIANAITFTGQKMIKVATTKLSEMNESVIYGDSVVGESKVFVNGKDIRIDKLFNKYNYFKENINGKDIIDSNKLNLYTLSVDDKGKIFSNIISKIIRHKTTKKLYKITTKSGKSIIVTEDEGILIYDENNSIKKVTPKHCLDKKIYLPTIPDDIECQVCYRRFKSLISNTHLYHHNLTIDEYKKLYKGFPTSSIYHKENLKGRIPWNKNLPWSQEVINKLIESHLGQVTWNTGLTKNKDERVVKHAESVSIANSNMSEEGRKNISNGMKNKWQDEEYVKMMTLAHDMKPNKLEQVFINEFDFLEYVGDGTLFLGRRTPDFRVRGKHKLIEVFGDYWHKGEDPSILINHYKKYDWECIVIWENEVRNNFESVKAKVIEFASS